MGFVMKVSDCQITACSGSLGGEAAANVADACSAITTNDNFQSPNPKHFAAALKERSGGTNLPSANIDAVYPQQIAGIKSNEPSGGRGV